MRCSPAVRSWRGSIPLIFSVVALAATLIPNPALAGEGSVTKSYYPGLQGALVWPCDAQIKAGPIQNDVNGACFRLTGIEKTPASIAIRDAAGLSGWFEYRIFWRDGGWVEGGWGYACGSSLSIDTLPPHDPTRQVYLQVQLLQTLDDNTRCPKGIYTTGTITFSFTT